MSKGSKGRNYTWNWGVGCQQGICHGCYKRKIKANHEEEIIKEEAKKIEAEKDLQRVK